MVDEGTGKPLSGFRRLSEVETQIKNKNAENVMTDATQSEQAAADATRTLNREQLIKNIHSNSVHNDWKGDWHDDVAGEIYHQKKAKAAQHGTVDDDDHYKPAGGKKSTKDLEKLAEDKKKYEERIADPSRDEALKKWDRKDLEKVNKDLTKHGKEVSESMGKSAEYHRTAIAEARKAQDKLIKDGRKAFNDEVKNLRAQRSAGTIATDAELEKKLNHLDENYRNFEAHVEEKFKDIVEVHDEHLTSLTKAAEKVTEHSGVKVDLGKTPAATTEKAAAEGMKVFDKIKARGVQSGVGALLILPKMAEMLGITEAERDPNTGEKKSSVGVNVAALGGVAALLHAAIADPKVQKAAAAMARV